MADSFGDIRNYFDKLVTERPMKGIALMRISEMGNWSDEGFIEWFKGLVEAKEFVDEYRARAAERKRRHRARLRGLQK